MDYGTLLGMLSSICAVGAGLFGVVMWMIKSAQRVMHTDYKKLNARMDKVDARMDKMDRNMEIRDNRMFMLAMGKSMKEIMEAERAGR